MVAKKIKAEVEFSLYTEPKQISVLWGVLLPALTTFDSLWVACEICCFIYYLLHGTVLINMLQKWLKLFSQLHVKYRIIMIIRKT